MHPTQVQWCRGGRVWQSRLCSRSWPEKVPDPASSPKHPKQFLLPSASAQTVRGKGGVASEAPESIFKFA